MMKSINKMRSYYRAILSEVGIAYNINKEDLHDMLKVGYHIKSTATLTCDEWYEYIDNIIYFIASIFSMLFDSEGYELDGISWVWLYGTMKPEGYKNLF